MARIRSIKPDAFTSLSLSEVERGIRWTFAGLWTHCDDEGRAEWEPRLLKAALYPVDDDITAADIDHDMKALESIGAVCFYAVGGKNYFHIPSFSEHQHPNRKVPSRLPKCSIHDDSASTDSSTDSYGSESAVSEQGAHTPVVVVVDGVVDVDVTSVKEPRKRGTRIPEDWKRTPADIEWQHSEKITDAQARRETEKFVSHFLAASGQSAVKRDWSQAWKNWIRTAADRQGWGGKTAPAESDRPKDWQFGS